MVKAQDAIAIAQWNKVIEDCKAQYRTTPSNQTSKLEALREKIENAKRQIAAIEAYK